MTRLHQHHDDGYDPDFDARAATWDDPAKMARAREVASAIIAAVGPGPSSTVFEYGAGTGLVTEALGEHVGPAVLADTSSGMREVMAAKVLDGRLRDARIIDLDLDLDDVELPEARFDLVISVLTLHHVADLGLVLGRLVGLLAAGGSLCVVDLDAEDGSFHGHGFTGHDGFDREAFAALLLEAGASTVRVEDCGRIERDDGVFTMFLAVAGAPASSAPDT